MSVSAPTGASNIDLVETIIAGGDGFAERLKTFKAAAKEAKAAKAEAADILAQAKADADGIMQEALATKAAADRQFSENRSAAEELAAAQALANAAEAKFTRKYEELMAAIRG